MNDTYTETNRHVGMENLPQWIVERGMQGLPLTDQISGFCQRIYDAGFPMRRVQMGMFTLHPRYGSLTFVWRPGSGSVEYKLRERDAVLGDLYLKSPVFYMRTRGLQTLRRRVDGDEEPEFQLFEELRSEGLVDYAAFLVPYDPDQARKIRRAATDSGENIRPGGALDGIFFSCATDEPEGFDPAHIAQVQEVLPYLALAVKSRLTYDVANTVLATYLGADAGNRVLTGAIERGSAEAIDAVIWFADLRGFTAMTDTLPRDLLVETLNDYLDEVTKPVEAHNGQILKFMGDGVLATFDLTGRDGADVCRDALTAASELRAWLPEFNEQRRAADKPVMDFGLALHLGEVFYGNIGASERLDFTVIGPAVNEASRIQSLCKPLDRNILLSGAFRDAIGQTGDLETLGRHELRGVREPQELFGLR